MDQAWQGVVQRCSMDVLDGSSDRRYAAGISMKRDRSVCRWDVFGRSFEPEDPLAEAAKNVAAMYQKKRGRAETARDLSGMLATCRKKQAW